MSKVQHKLDLDKNIIFVDVSYLTFYRFFALKRWFTFAHNDIDTTSPNFKWLDNPIFYEKYEKTLLDTILKIAKSKQCKVPLNNIIFAFDCHHKDIWRLKYCNNANVECPAYNQSYSYKGDRKEALKKQHFDEYKVFDLVKNDFLPKFTSQHSNVILEHKNAEADDCIALGIKKLINNNKFKKNIWIIASDLDYLQICDQRIHLMDLKKNQLDTKHLQESNISSQDYLLRKILIGDKSDNIFPCQFNQESVPEINQLCNLKLRKNKKGEYNVTVKTLEKIKECPSVWKSIQDYFNENKTVMINNKKQKSGLICFNQEIFDINQRLIDFDLIPKSIKIKM